MGSACDDGAVEPTPLFDLAGAYRGPISATAGPASLDAVLLLEVARADDGIVGSYALIGSLVYDGAVASVEGDGTFTGTVGSGEEPSIDILVRTPLCDAYEGVFAGRFIPTTGRLILGGSVDIFGSGCSVLVRFDVVMNLFQETPPNV